MADYEVEFTLEPQAEIDAELSIEFVNSDHNALTNRDLPDQHPISAITGLEEALNHADKTFIYEQAVASATWQIQHNLDKYPSVEVIDTANNKIETAVEWIDENNLIVRMNAATKGKAYLN